MSNLVQVEAIPEIKKLQMHYIFQINEASVGCAILLGYLIELSLIPTYSYSRRFLKTK